MDARGCRVKDKVFSEDGVVVSSWKKDGFRRLMVFCTEVATSKVVVVVAAVVMVMRESRKRKR